MEYARQELDGLFTDAIGYVYGMFDRSVHMVPPPSLDPEYYPVRVGGIDPGTRDPYAAGIWVRDADRHWYQAWEFHETGGSSSRFGGLFKREQEKWRVSKWYCDKRSPSAVIDLRDAGVRAVPNIDIHGENDAHTIAPMVAVPAVLVIVPVFSVLVTFCFAYAINDSVAETAPVAAASVLLPTTSRSSTLAVESADGTV